jgi:RNA polymerase sigma factor (sigma-70 family)
MSTRSALEDLDKVYREHHDQVRRHASGLLGARQYEGHGADDVAQEVWKRACERPGGSQDPPDDWNTWLIKTVTTVAGTIKRRARRHPTVECNETLCTKAGIVIDLAEADHGSAHILREAIQENRIPREDVRAIWMKKEGYSRKEIAAELGIEVENVTKRLQRGRERAREILEEAGWTPSE